MSRTATRQSALREIATRRGHCGQNGCEKAALISLKDGVGIFLFNTDNIVVYLVNTLDKLTINLDISCLYILFPHMCIPSPSQFFS